MLCFFLGGSRGQIQRDVFWRTGGRFLPSPAILARGICFFFA
jgi:hypothetical protein